MAAIERNTVLEEPSRRARRSASSCCSPALLAVLALFSYDPHDPNIFSWTAGGEAGSPEQLDRRLRRVAGRRPLRPVRPGGLGRRRPALRPRAGGGSGSARCRIPATKAAGLGAARSSPSRCCSRSRSAGGRLFGEEMETGRHRRPRRWPTRSAARIGTTGAVLLAITLVLLADPAGDAGLARRRLPAAARPLRRPARAG